MHSVGLRLPEEGFRADPRIPGTSLAYWKWAVSRSSAQQETADKLYALHEQLPGCATFVPQLRDAIQSEGLMSLTPRVRSEVGLLRIATFTPSVMGDRLGRNPPSTATFTPLIARSADVATRPWVWWRSRGPPKYRRASYEQANSCLFEVARVPIVSPPMLSAFPPQWMCPTIDE
jgi:hypothetical protein